MTDTTPAFHSQTDAALGVYDRLAAFYDRYTAHHRYDEWMPSIEAIAIAHGLAGKRLLDVACGTGKSFMPMLARGYEVTACDRSPAMLAQARRKAGGRVALLECDMRALPPLGPFDLVTCVDDALNYLHEPDDLAAAFASVARCLRPGGLYAFDLNTLHAFRTLFADSDAYEVDGWRCAWRGLGDPSVEPGGLSAAVVEVVEPGGGATHADVHVQRHHPPGLVERLLAGAGLEPLAVVGQHQSGAQDPVADEDVHTKAVYLARRSGA